MSDLWAGLSLSARERLAQRNYSQTSLPERLGTSGVEAGEIAGKHIELKSVWIPGVRVFSRKIYPQRHRGLFGEFARMDEGELGAIGMWPKQWAAARMFTGTAKGFHIHPPHIPEGHDPEAWFQRLYVEHESDYSLRPYALEQWDAMFFVQGNVEMILVDERMGMPRRVMRFLIEGDDHRSTNNAGLVIPAGVAHALRVEGSADAIMVYGTTTTFRAEFEGRIAADLESAPLPPDWERYLT